MHSCVAPQLVVGAGSKILRPRHGHADADADAAALGSTPGASVANLPSRETLASTRELSFFSFPWPWPSWTVTLGLLQVLQGHQGPRRQAFLGRHKAAGPGELAAAEGRQQQAGAGAAQGAQTSNAWIVEGEVRGWVWVGQVGKIGARGRVGKTDHACTGRAVPEGSAGKAARGAGPRTARRATAAVRTCSGPHGR